MSERAELAEARNQPKPHTNGVVLRPNDEGGGSAEKKESRRPTEVGRADGGRNNDERQEVWENNERVGRKRGDGQRRWKKRKLHGYPTAGLPSAERTDKSR